MGKTTKIYWNDLWVSTSGEIPADPCCSNLDNYVNQRFNEYFISLFDGIVTQGKELLEIGCARSFWLPYFAREFGFRVTGIDYSFVGCALANGIIRKQEIPGDIICADLFLPPLKIPEAFDVVVSFGLVEHFEETTSCLKAIARLLKPGGLMITSIPNMAGLMGTVQKFIDADVYNLHEILDASDLRTAHQNAGVMVRDCGYFLSFNSGVVNKAKIKETDKKYFLKSLLHSNLYRLTKLLWLFEKVFFTLPPTRVLSPYIVCTAQKTISKKVHGIK